MTARHNKKCIAADTTSQIEVTQRYLPDQVHQLIGKHLCNLFDTQDNSNITIKTKTDSYCI